MLDPALVGQGFHLSEQEKTREGSSKRTKEKDSWEGDGEVKVMEDQKKE